MLSNIICFEKVFTWTCTDVEMNSREHVELGYKYIGI